MERLVGCEAGETQTSEPTKQKYSWVPLKDLAKGTVKRVGSWVKVAAAQYLSKSWDDAEYIVKMKNAVRIELPDVRPIADRILETQFGDHPQSGEGDPAPEH